MLKLAPLTYVDLLTGESFGRKGTGQQPVPKHMPEIQGLFVGGCVADGVGTTLHVRGKVVIAHAHIGSMPFKGWVCYRNPQVFQDPANEYVIWHEYAHIRTNQGHTDKWRAMMTKLGQPIPDFYAPRQRRATS